MNDYPESWNVIAGHERIEELVKATLIMGARRADDSLDHSTALALVERSIPSLTKRFMGAVPQPRDRPRPKVVCFCGSTRFTAEMLVIKWEYEKRGIIVMTWNNLPAGYQADEGNNVAEAEGVKEQIDELHKRKIDLSDEVFVININGYIGESTRSEIEYAERVGRPVRYLEGSVETEK